MSARGVVQGDESFERSGWGMRGSGAIIALYVLSMVAAIVAVDVLFLRHHFFGRLLVNVGIVLVAAALYLTFVKHR